MQRRELFKQGLAAAVGSIATFALTHPLPSKAQSTKDGKF